MVLWVQKMKLSREKSFQILASKLNSVLNSQYFHHFFIDNVKLNTTHCSSSINLLFSSFKLTILRIKLSSSLKIQHIQCSMLDHFKDTLPIFNLAKLTFIQWLFFISLVSYFNILYFIFTEILIYNTYCHILHPNDTKNTCFSAKIQIPTSKLSFYTIFSDITTK